MYDVHASSTLIIRVTYRIRIQIYPEMKGFFSYLRLKVFFQNQLTRLLSYSGWYVLQEMMLRYGSAFGRHPPDKINGYCGLIIIAIISLLKIILMKTLLINVSHGFMMTVYLYILFQLIIMHKGYYKP